MNPGFYKICHMLEKHTQFTKIRIISQEWEIIWTTIYFAKFAKAKFKAKESGDQTPVKKVGLPRANV